MDKNPGSAFPNAQGFFSQNGGEARLSYKGFPPGYARMIMSPANFSIQEMQIDTWNRDSMNLTGPTAFVAGTALSGPISTVLTGLSWTCVGIHSRRALPAPVCT